MLRFNIVYIYIYMFGRHRVNMKRGTGKGKGNLLIYDCLILVLLDRFECGWHMKNAR